MVDITKFNGRIPQGISLVFIQSKFPAFTKAGQLGQLQKNHVCYINKQRMGNTWTEGKETTHHI